MKEYEKKFDELKNTYNGKLLRKACVLVSMGMPGEKEYTPIDAYRLLEDLVNNQIDILETIEEIINRLDLGHERSKDN